MRISALILFFSCSLLLFFCLYFYSCKASPPAQQENQFSGVPAKKPFVDKGMIVLDDRPKSQNIFNPQDSFAEVTLSFVGDLMCHMPQVNNAKTDSIRYNFNPSFEWVKSYLEQSDITIGNLELTCAGSDKGYSGYPSFNAPDEYISSLKESGFDYLVTANNHSMDKGEGGLLRTIEVIKKNQLGYAGTFLSQRDHDSCRVINVKGVKIALLNYTYGTNGAYPDSKRKYMLNVIDSFDLHHDITAVKNIGVDFIAVFFHFGVEYGAEPNETQKKAVRWARQAGAQIVVGAHPHVIGPCRWLVPDIDHVDTTFVAWSLGNFLSNQNSRFTDAGMILTLRLKKNFTKNKVFFGTADYLPTWVYRGERLQKKMHIIFPSQLSEYRSKLPVYLDSSLVFKMKQAYEDTKAMVNKYGQAVQLKNVR